MKVLAIETSCDETACAIVEQADGGNIKVLAEAKATSEELHKKTKGIVPELAAREQVISILPVVDAVIDNSKLKIENLDAIAVTVGPGLIGSLLVGVETAKTLALVWEKPLIPVNHLMGHLYSGWIEGNPKFPVLGMVVSGGHTDMVLMESEGQIRWLGGTVDDAAGECFDKCARVILDASYPGGPAVAQAATKFKDQKSKLKIKLPRPMLNSDDYNFSFSGLKTAVINRIKNPRQRAGGQESRITNEYKCALAHELQEAIVEVLIAKLVNAIEEFGPKSLVIGGGVVANERFREELKKIAGEQKIKLFLPEIKHAKDNAAMIGVAALKYIRQASFDYTQDKQGKLNKFNVSDILKIKADPGLSLEGSV